MSGTSGALPPNDGRHLWTPWRMQYVGGDAREPGCVFCNRLAGTNDVTSLIVHRDPDVFIIMNLYPYNTAHLMIVPNDHVASPETASDAVLARLGTLLAPVTRALRRVLGCHGFNVGVNVGDVAGAGVAEHLHQHVVPRWTGDANFMPILAGTTVMPELLQVTYAKVRAEIQRELATRDQPGRDAVRVLLTDESGAVLVEPADDGPRLPRVSAELDLPLWRAAMDSVAPYAMEPALIGWAGNLSVGRTQAAIFAIRAERITPSSLSTMIATTVADAARILADPDDARAISLGFTSSI